MAVLYIGDSLFRYLRINRPGADVRFSRGAHVEQLLEGMSDIKEFQVRVSFLHVYVVLPSILLGRVQTSKVSLPNISTFSVIQNVLTVCRC